MQSCRTIVAGLLGLLLAGAASAGEPTECDRLAGSPTDPNRAGAGIGLYGIEPAEAIAACEKVLAADPNNPRLLFNLGRAHDASSLVDKWPDHKTQAGRNFKAAADQGYSAAQVALAAFYWYGWGGFQRDPGQAMRLLAKAIASDAKEANAQRQNLFGDTTFNPDANEAQIRIIKEAADAGDADALYALSLPLNLGGSPVAQAELARLLHKAAAHGSAPAARDLARLYFRGSHGLAKNPDESSRLFQQAAAGDDPEAWESIAMLYERGNFGLPKDEKQAARLYQQASNEGVASAQYDLARFYEEGKAGLPRDAREAARLYGLAADQGNSDAVLALARYMAEGLGGFEASKARAIEYLRRAARWSTRAKDELARMGAQ
ncbi:SEL1-like repeat protein [Bradyrhizobium iriomotense]|uniref:SEL1-like repeat protein n=1 Tax=Bradyrhizobium iriomotense TaxID=441950 RepID=UPI001B8A61D8|nr:tetratricopeptide repeat protein [Bradyrhizobium iriomotense]MBR1129480.1 sel1 repeat family protein [Bradyrhizobium iriomotense]